MAAAHPDFDLAVVGAGLAGASLARAARGQRVALIARERVARLMPDSRAPFDARVYAITPGNAAFLSELKVWQAIPETRRTPVHSMCVYGDDGAAMLEFDAWNAGVAELAWVVEDGFLQAALARSLEARDEVEVFAPAQCRRIDRDESCAQLHLDDGRVLRARLVVGADGARSFVRTQAAIAAQERSYGQSAVVANFACGRPHRNRALQWFQGGPVLALLPLPGDHVSMVWSTAEAEAARLLALDAPQFCRAVETASHGVPGELSLVTPPRVFPLRRVKAHRLVAPRVALVGDAAHVVHPLAGQGANLGLQDVRELAAVLAAGGPVRDPGELGLLRRYERARAEPVFAMGATVDGLFRLFGAPSGALARLRNAGLRLTDHMPMVKNLLMRQAMS